MGMTKTVSGDQGSSLPREMHELLDSRAILSCLQRIARGMDRFDRELFLSAFHADAVIEAGVIVSGPEEAYEHGFKMHDQAQKSTLHYLTNHTCEIDGEAAHAETYFFFVAHNRDDTQFATGGRYVDRLERREGAWRVAFRHTILEWSGPLLSGTLPLFGEAPDLHLNGSPGRSKDDPSYRRPFLNRRALRLPDAAESLTTPDA
jgi:hypothetical protein